AFRPEHLNNTSPRKSPAPQRPVQRNRPGRNCRDVVSVHALSEPADDAVAVIAADLDEGEFESLFAAVTAGSGARGGLCFGCHGREAPGGVYALVSLFGENGLAVSTGLRTKIETGLRDRFPHPT